MAKRIVVGISGASGAVYAQRLVQLLVASGVETHLVVSPVGQRMLHEELAMDGIDLDRLSALGAVVAAPQADPDGSVARGTGSVRLHAYRDVGAVIATGSFQHDGMVIVPCSSNSLAAVASGSAQNLLHRAAAVTLKERRRLVLVHRETPVSLVELRNMQLVTEAGAIVCPANPGFYMLPETIQDLIDFVAGRVLDLLGVAHSLNVRWGEQPSKQEPPRPSSCV